MNNTCLSCGQILPKTVLVCPNCGGRQFSSPNSANNSAAISAQTTQYHVPFDSQLTTNNISQPVSQIPSQATLQPQATVSTPMLNPVPQHKQNYIQNPVPNLVPSHTPNTTQNYAQSYAQSYHQNPSQTYAPPAAVPTYLPPVTTAPLRQANTMQYAGFIRRGFAFVFDVALFSLLTGLAWQHITNNKYKIMYVPNSELPLTLTIAGGILYLLVTAFLTSRARQGSIGKRMLGLWVFNMQGQRIGFFHAFFREVVKLALLPFAFVMWFTARKQTLHDLLGRTVVLLDK